MANVVYSEKYDSARMALELDGIISKIASTLNDLYDVKEKAEYLSNIALDNGDVGFALTEALEHLGKTLAIAVSYRDEYREEADSDKKID